jgi:hypothetical protein
MKQALNHVSPAAHAGETEGEKEMGLALRAVQEDASAQQERNFAAKELAVQLGYEGGLSVDALEGEIRFWQRRTVEACLELGKRLLIMKAVSPHGEFGELLEKLGFTKMSASRFMTAAARTSKSNNLVLLSSQVKNMSAFLELVTTDDEVLDDVKKIEGIECLSASELRKKIKELQAENDAKDKVLEGKNKQIDKLQIIQTMSAADKSAEVRKKAVQINNEALGMIRGSVRNAVVTIQQVEGESHSSTILIAAMLAELQQELNAIREDYSIPDISGSELLDAKNDVEQWYGKGIDGGEGQS